MGETRDVRADGLSFRWEYVAIHFKKTNFDMGHSCSALVFLLLLQSTPVSENASSVGTGLEWMTVASVLIPALILVFLVYLDGRVEKWPRHSGQKRD